MKHLIVVLLLFSYSNIAAAQSKKRSWKELRANITQVENLDTNGVKQGKYLDVATELDRSTFVRVYLYNNCRANKSLGPMTKVQLIYQFENYSYYVTCSDNSIHGFSKIRTNLVEKINWDQLSKYNLQDRFYEEIISEETKQYFPKPDKNFDYLNYNCKPLTFRENMIISHKIVVEKNNFFETKYRKFYQASYNINTGELIKLYEGKRRARNR